MYTVYFDHIHLLLPLSMPPLSHVLLFYSPLSPLNGACMRMGVAIYQGPQS